VSLLGVATCLAEEVGCHNKPDSVVSSEGDKGQLKLESACKEDKRLRYERNSTNWEGFNDETCNHTSFHFSEQAVVLAAVDII
jgi:hypothetical protein